MNDKRRNELTSAADRLKEWGKASIRPLRSAQHRVEDHEEAAFMVEQLSKTGACVASRDSDGKIIVTFTPAGK